MLTECKYDVFISYSRKDYEDEQKQPIPGNAIVAIKNAFDKNGITYWFDEEGIYSGQPFVDIITDAIATSKVFLFISSINSNDSKWTRSEILEAFDADKHIIPFKLDNSEYHKSLRFYLRPLDFISYYDNDEDALRELIRSVNNIKQDFEEERQKEHEIIRQKEIKDKIKELSDDYHMLVMRQEAIVKELIEHNKAIGKVSKQCPICDRIVPIGDAFCERCGWLFPTTYSLDNDSHFVDNKDLITIYRTNWKSLNGVETIKKEKYEINNKFHQIQSKYQNMIAEIDKLGEIIKTKDFEIINLRDECSDLKVKLNKIEKQKIELDSYINTLQNEKTRLEQDFSQLEQLNKQLQKENEYALQQINILGLNVDNTQNNISSDGEYWDVILKDAGLQKLAVVKIIKDITCCGLKEAKDIADAAPYGLVMNDVSYDEATKVKSLLERAGARVQIAKAGQQNMNNDHTIYDVILEDAGLQKLAVVKQIKDIAYLGLKEAKDIVDAAPCGVVMNNVSYDEAIKVKSILEIAGARVKIVKSK